MIYRYDQPVDMPIPELYDTGLMQAYTQAIREQFEKGEKRLDEFASKYGNFTSPFAKDIQDWDRLTMGRINNIYNDLVSRGIDPLRSREGQAAMAQAIRQTPVGKLNMMLQSAEVGKSYQKPYKMLFVKINTIHNLKNTYQTTPESEILIIIVRLKKGFGIGRHLVYIKLQELRQIVGTMK